MRSHSRGGLYFRNGKILAHQRKTLLSFIESAYATYSG